MASRGCSTGKQRFRTELDGKIILARVQSKDSPRREKVEKRVYHCPRCRGWHLTSKAKDEKPQKFKNSRSRSSKS